MLLCWGGNYIAAKIVFREIPAGLVIILRTLVAGALMIPIYWLEARKRPPVLTWSEFRLLFILGIGGITINQLFWTLGVARTTVIHSSMIGRNRMKGRIPNIWDNESTKSTTSSLKTMR